MVLLSGPYFYFFGNYRLFSGKAQDVFWMFQYQLRFLACKESVDIVSFNNRKTFGTIATFY